MKSSEKITQTEKLPKKERDTVINFNEAEPRAEVFTYNKHMLRQLKKLAKKRPFHVQYLWGNRYGASSYSIPKTWLKIQPEEIFRKE